PALGGLVAVGFGLHGVVVTDSISYLIAAAMIGAIAARTKPERAIALAVTARERVAETARDWRAGLNVIRESAVLRVVLVAFALASLGEGVMQTGFWVYVEETL